MSLVRGRLPPSVRLRGSLYAPRLGRNRGIGYSHPQLGWRSTTSTKLLWAIPVGTGFALYLTPKSESTLHQLCASPSIIPCSSQEKEPHIINSPAEERRSILSRLWSLFYDRVWEPVLTGRRFIYLFFLFLPVILSSPMLLFGRLHQGESRGAILWYDFLVSQMERAGPTFIKLAQWAGSRADLFPAQLCQRLGDLHSHGKPHSLAHTKRVIEKVFQRHFDDVFEEFEEAPIGTGAIAQVYRATLKQDLIPPSHLTPKRSPPTPIGPVIRQDPAPSVPSNAVAIKILHPRVKKTITRDLSIMNFFARSLSLLPGMQWLSLPEEVEVFGKLMNMQLDLRNEADNLNTFENNFAPRKVPVMFPRPLKNWSTEDLLIEEYMHALPLESVMRNGGGPFDKQLATVGLDAFLNMLLLDNFVHSDLHPGNIMIKFSRPLDAIKLLKNVASSLFGSGKTAAENLSSPDFRESDEIVSRLEKLKHDPVAWRNELASVHAEGYIPELVFIDAGLVTTLSAANRENFLDLFRAVANFDGYRTGLLMVERCRSPEQAIDVETFALKMQNLVLSVKRKTFSLGQVKISDVLTEVLKAVRVHHVKMEGDFINTVISILLLEGIGRQLDPGLDLFKSALPILRQLGRQMSVEEGRAHLDRGSLGAMVKVYLWLEARDLASSAVANADDLVKYDLLTPGI